MHAARTHLILAAERGAQQHRAQMPQHSQFRSGDSERKSKIPFDFFLSFLFFLLYSPVSLSREETVHRFGRARFLVSCCFSRRYSPSLVDHAGEFGAQRIYEGQLAVFRGTPLEPVIQV